MPATQRVFPSIEAIRQPVTTDLTDLDALIIVELSSKVPLIEEVIRYLLDSGGKRVRPLLLLLTTAACGYSSNIPEHHELACVIEFLHTATLLHDDVVDCSERRRGSLTANIVWSNAASVLVGDFLYSRAFQILAKRDNVPVMRVLANATNLIAEGEMRQLANQHQGSTDVEEYYRVIEAKTAALFGAAAQIGAMLGHPQDKALADKMYTMGSELGIAFQIIDDILDYAGDAEITGKNLGDDLQEGKITLPLIYAIERSPKETADEIIQMLQGKKDKDLGMILEAIKATKACEHCQEKAESHINRGKTMLATLPESAARTALHSLFDFVIKRSV